MNTVKRIAIPVLIAVALYACGSGTEQQQNSSAQHDSAVSASTRTNTSFLNDYNAIESVFGNENWMKVDGKDTSYHYFSRLGQFDFNTYAYKLVKGDSAQVAHGKLEGKGDQLAWTFEGKKLMIQSATAVRVSARDAADTSAVYTFTRLDNNSVGLTYPGGKKIVLKKTIPFGLFLVRSRYDYANGTRYAFDTTDFRKHRK